MPHPEGPTEKDGLPATLHHEQLGLPANDSMHTTGDGVHRSRLHAKRTKKTKEGLVHRPQPSVIEDEDEQMLPGELQQQRQKIHRTEQELRLPEKGDRLLTLLMMQE